MYQEFLKEFCDSLQNKNEIIRSTYAKDMEIEVRGMAQYRVALELSAESGCQSMRLQSDGTTKF